MADKIKIHPYSISAGKESESIVDVINRIENDSLNDRIRKIKFAEIRVDDILKKDGLIFLDFVKLRGTHGPGKASQTDPASGFEFKPGERFAEETALLYDSNSGVVFVQYNHHGSRVGIISEYFNIYTGNPKTSIEFLPKMTHDFERRLESKSIIKSVEISVSPAILQGTDRDLSIEKALSMLEQSSGSSRINMVLRAGKGKSKSLNNSKARSLINWIQSKISTGAISAAKIRAKNDIDSEIELIDMIAERLYSTQTITTGNDLRWPRQERYNCLSGARDELSGSLT